MLEKGNDAKGTKGLIQRENLRFTPDSQPPRFQPLGEKSFHCLFSSTNFITLFIVGFLITWDLLWHRTGNRVSFPHGLSYPAPLPDWSIPPTPRLSQPPLSHLVCSTRGSLTGLTLCSTYVLFTPCINTTFWPMHPFQKFYWNFYLKHTEFTGEHGESRCCIPWELSVNGACSTPLISTFFYTCRELL